jgi:hypothetical protein
MTEFFRIWTVTGRGAPVVDRMPLAFHPIICTVVFADIGQQPRESPGSLFCGKPDDDSPSAAGEGRGEGERPQPIANQRLYPSDANPIPMALVQ